MKALNVVIIVLWFLLLAGGIFFVLNVLKDILDKKAAEKRLEALQTQFNDFQKLVNLKITEYQKSYEALNQEYKSYRKENESILKSANDIIDKILNYTDKITLLNRQFFDKITLISHLLNEENPPAEEIEKLAHEISNDIDEQTKLQKEREIIQREREEAIMRQRQQQLKKEQNHGHDFER